MMQPIVFFGSSPFSVPVLEKLVLSARCQVLGVVTTPDKPVGRHLKLTPNPVKVLAQKNNIKVIYDLGSMIYEEGTIGLVAAYGKIIPQEILDKFNGQIYNIHPSLLPKYRGPSPLQQQILDGAVDTGVTIIKMDSQMDHGPIVTTISDKILPDDTTITLGNRLFELGVNWIIENLLEIENWKLKIQNENLATHTKKLTRQDGFLPWEEFTKLITDSTPFRHAPRFRAFHPWPGVWTIDSRGQRQKLMSLDPLLIRRHNSP